jgi:exopolyphosphatase/guanosine-5'-triphosphate,3'-diphosphate pyrophosphatase
MGAERRAVIDIGTNSVKLLVAETDGLEVNPLAEESRQTRLGQGLFQSNVLQPEAIQQTVEAVATFAHTAAQWQVPHPRVIATSAARDALNGADLVKAIQQRLGLPVEIISGQQEAEWAFRGVASAPALRHQPLLLVEVGGGSTQVILGQADHQQFQQSLPLGSVRLLEQFRPTDPPAPQELDHVRHWLTDFLERELGPALGLRLRQLAGGSVRLVGTGGTVTILARMAKELSSFDRAAIEGTRLSLAWIQQTTTKLWSLSLAERRALVGLPPNRADVILFGICIYEAFMVHLNLPELYVSTRGVRFGAILDWR